MQLLWTGPAADLCCQQVEFKTPALDEQVKQLSNDISKNLDYWIAQKQQALLNGETDVSNIPPITDLADPIGSNNITNNVYFSETIDVADMKDFVSGAGIKGTTLPGVEINFQQITSDTMLDALNGHGFDTTCRTCDEQTNLSITTKGKMSVSTLALIPQALRN